MSHAAIPIVSTRQDTMVWEGKAYVAHLHGGCSGCAFQTREANGDVGCKMPRGNSFKRFCSRGWGRDEHAAEGTSIVWRPAPDGHQSQDENIRVFKGGLVMFANPHGGCKTCAFHTKPEGVLSQYCDGERFKPVGEGMRCSGSTREDRQSIIWLQKPAQEINEMKTATFSEDQNTVTLGDGRRYEAVQQAGCSGCAFFDISGGCTARENMGLVSYTHCTVGGRKDNRSIIWKLIQQEQTVEAKTTDEANSYDVIDRFLRNNLDDAGYREYSAHLDNLTEANGDLLTALRHAFKALNRIKHPSESTRNAIATIKPVVIQYGEN